MAFAEDSPTEDRTFLNLNSFTKFIFYSLKEALYSIEKYLSRFKNFNPQRDRMNLIRNSLLYSVHCLI